MTERRGFHKLALAFVQSAPTLVVAYLLSFVKETEIHFNTMLYLYMLHYVAFYFSDYNHDFFKRGQLSDLMETLKYSLFFALSISFSSFLLEEKFSISRRGMVYFLLLSALLLYLENYVIRKYWRRFYYKLKGSHKILLITATSRIDKVLERLLLSNDSGGELVAVSVLDRPDFRHEKVRVVAEKDLMAYATHEVVDEVFINLPSEKYDIGEFVSKFETMGIDVTVNLNAFDLNFAGNKRIREVAGLNVVTFSTNFYKPSHVTAKRVIDICGSLVGLLICGLVAIVLVPLIRKDGGPAIFAQKRVGKNGRYFKFYKFRSMYVDAEERKKELMAQNTMKGGMFKMDNDPRITPIGRFIRKTSLDELPQFYNVLKGDMSLVGTRPPTVDEYEQYTPEQKRRLSFKPGITGLWQVSGRSEITDFDEVVRLDVSYIDGWTIWSDIKILLKTIKVVFKRDGAK
ncbi:galactosyl transferase [Streptococcus rubneri]|uniref:Sugar transferase n=1 Tax=Streptococcus rubneri TaxID=1234680 RepID=A0A4Z1DW11_9STRE|nr:sugar transferase [Streptococcus rubneri]MBK4773983.1 galactosyl transferase [Streptococcus rubneri]TGN92761.1 sugar transferase [Streptococcus rubneri]